MLHWEKLSSDVPLKLQPNDFIMDYDALNQRILILHDYRRLSLISVSASWFHSGTELPSLSSYHISDPINNTLVHTSTSTRRFWPSFMVYSPHHNHLVVFSKDRSACDTLRYDFSDATWAQVYPPKECKNATGMFRAYARDPVRGVVYIYIHHHMTLVSRLWQYNIKDVSWMELKLEGKTPRPVYGSMVLDAARNELLVVGLYNSELDYDVPSLSRIPLGNHTTTLVAEKLNKECMEVKEKDIGRFMYTQPPCLDFLDHFYSKDGQTFWFYSRYAREFRIIHFFI
jgi:hypothetical protein